MKQALSNTLLPGLLALALLAPRATAQTGGRSDERSERAWLGLYIRNLDREEARRLELRPGTEGVVVSSVDEGGPAARAGVQSGDVITEIDARPVRDQRAFVRAVQNHDPGDTVRLTVVRDGSTQTYEVELQGRDADTQDDTRGDESTPSPTPSPGRWTEARPRLGVEVAELNPDLASYFGVSAGEGVLVTRVQQQTGAARAGLKPGDVIVRVDGKPVRSVEGLRQILQDHQSGDTVDVVVRRKNREETLRVDVTDVGLPQPGGFRSFDMPSPGASSPFDDNQMRELQRQLRDLQRQVDELEREVRSQRRR